MSILADHQIRQLCTLPTFVITTNIPRSTSLGIYNYPKPVDSFSYLSENEIKAEITKVRSHYNNGMLIDEKILVGIVKYRPLTQEEKDSFKPMISPYSEVSVKVSEDGKKIPSWGSSSYGYDIRIGRNFKLFRKPLNEQTNIPVIDICDFSITEHEIITTYEDVDFIEIPPHGFALGHSLEHINMPRDITSICMGKSTIARSGLHMCITPLEANWSGYITIELENMTDYPIRVHSGIGISQLLFLKSDSQCNISYSDRGGKYQNQECKPITPKN